MLIPVGGQSVKYRCMNDVIKCKVLLTQIISTKILKIFLILCAITAKQCIKTMVVHKGHQNTLRTAVVLLVCIS